MGQQILHKTLVFSVIQTQIIGVEGKHADHLTTTTAHELKPLVHTFDWFIKFVLYKIITLKISWSVKNPT